MPTLVNPPNYDQGDLVRVTAIFTTSAGTAIDPTTVKLAYRADSIGVTTIFTYGPDAQLVRAGTGSYYVDLDTNDSPGRYEWNFYSTGTGQAAENGSFYVRRVLTTPAPPSDPPTTLSAVNVTFLQAGANAVERDLRDKSRDWVSVFDFMTPAQIAATRARTLTHSVVTAFNNAITYCLSEGVDLMCPLGDYLIDSKILLSGVSRLNITGMGMGTRFFNKAAAGNATFELAAASLNIGFYNLAICGHSSFPNHGFNILGGSSFLEFDRIFNNPNGKGWVVTDSNTCWITRSKYWQSNIANGATGSGTNRSHAFYNASGYCLGYHIWGCNFAGYESIANGGAGIYIHGALGVTHNITIENCQMESGGSAATHRAIDMDSAQGFLISHDFQENCQIKLSNCRSSTVRGWGGGGGVHTLTLDTGCLNINIQDWYGGTLNCDSSNDQISVYNSSFDTAYTNNATRKVQIGCRGVGGTPLPNILGETTNLQIGGGLTERGRTAGMGEWTTPAFNAGDFTSDSGTFVVASGDVTTYQWTIVGKNMTVNFNINTATITGTPNNLRIKIPGGFSTAKTVEVPYIRQNNGGALGTATALVLAAIPNDIVFFVDYDGTANWAAGADNNRLKGSITFEVA